MEDHCPVCGQWMKRQLPADIIAERWIAARGLTMGELKRDDRRAEIVEMRRRIAELMRGRGWTLEAIGNFLDRDRRTVQGLLHPRGGRRPWARRNDVVVR